MSLGVYSGVNVIRGVQWCESKFQTLLQLALFMAKFFPLAILHLRVLSRDQSQSHSSALQHFPPAYCCHTKRHFCMSLGTGNVENTKCLCF